MEDSQEVEFCWWAGIIEHRTMLHIGSKNDERKKIANQKSWGTSPKQRKVKRLKRSTDRKKQNKTDIAIQ